MFIKSIRITNFRSFSLLHTELSEGVNIFYGENGTGKTNLLESMFVLCLGRSHRSAPESVMVKDGSAFYRIEGEVAVGGGVQTLAVACEVSGRKKITLDKAPIRIAELYDTFCVVTSGPEDSEIVSGPPSARRSFVDIYLSQFSRKYLTNLSSYQKALLQKNAALRSGIDPSPFNELLVEHGADTIVARAEFLRSVGELAGGYYRKIARGCELELEYRPSVPFEGDASSREEITDAFRERLRERQEQERMVKTSLVGPHRDDIFLAVDSLPARTHGSQGEWRTTAIALKLSVYQLLREKRSMEPILLLDEIFAELDNRRSEGLIDSFEGFGQLCLATAAEPPESLRKGSKNYRISQGKIEEMN